MFLRFFIILFIISPSLFAAKIVVSHLGESNLSIIDMSKLRVIKKYNINSSLALGRPFSSEIYSSDPKRGIISIIDLKKNKVIKHLKVGRKPVTQFLFSKKGEDVYLLNRQDSLLTAMSTKTYRKKIETSVCNDPAFVAVDPNENFLYITCEKSNTLAIIDLKKLKQLKSIKLAQAPHGLSLFWKKKKVFVAHLDGTLGIVDLNKKIMIKKINFGGMLDHVEVLSKTNKVVVSNYSNGDLHIIDAVNNKLIKTIHLGGKPHLLAFTKDEKRVFLSDFEKGEIICISLRSMKVLKRVKIGKMPEFIELSEDGKRLFVTLFGEKSIGVIDTSSYRLIKRISTGLKPSHASIID